MIPFLLQHKKWLIAIVAVLLIFSTCNTTYIGSKYLYNTTVDKRLDYEKAERELVTFFDTKFLAYREKSNITNLNKDAFIVVTTIIMSGRKDGDKLAWKWLQENQPIPYNEFTDFYRDLSRFVEEQYGGMFAIENRKQQLVADYNKLIQIYPNNIYNSLFLHIPPLQYKYGYLSDETRRLFNIP